MVERLQLQALARQLGVIDSYRKTGVDGHLRYTSDATREALLAAMGIAVKDLEAAKRFYGETLGFPLIFVKRIGG